MVKKIIKETFENFFKSFISEEWILLLNNYTTKQLFTKNKRILSEGDQAKGVYFINSGKVKVVSYYDANNERLLRLSSSGDLLGHRAISLKHYPISAITLTDTEVTFIPIEIFKKVIKTNPEFAIYIIEFLANELKDTEERMKSMIHNDVVVRIGMIICMLIDAFGFDAKIPKKLYYTLSRTDMANFAGTTYESVIRNLAKLEEMKIIKLDKKVIHVLKEKELRRLVNIK